MGKLAELTPPSVLRARRKVKIRENGTHASRTIPAGRLRQDEKEHGEALDQVPPNPPLPPTRGDCEDGCRPCPMVSCKFNLYLDVNDKTGAIKLNFPMLEVHEIGESCALDVADKGGITLESLGDIYGLTRERIRQLEKGALRKVRAPMRESTK